MASQAERIAVLEEQVRSLTRAVESLTTEVHGLTLLARDGKSRLSTLFWLASLFSGTLGATSLYLVKTYLPSWPRF